MDRDGLDRLWAPYRMAYVTRASDRGDGTRGTDGSAADDGEESTCPFCAAIAMSDAEGLLVARGRLTCAMLNLYPYNVGHLLVLPYRHVADYTDVTEAEAVELAALTRRAMAVIRRVSAPHGFNIGINQGSSGGAGIAAHLHQHVVPRWDGDANFMTVVGHAKVLPQLLQDTRELLAGAW